jgi:hypothetical protein
MKMYVFLSIILFVFQLTLPFSSANNSLSLGRDTAYTDSLKDFYELNKGLKKTKMFPSTLIESDYSSKISVYKINTKRLSRSQFVNLAKNNFKIIGKVEISSTGYCIEGEKYRIEYTFYNNSFVLKLREDTFSKGYKSLYIKKEAAFPEYNQCREISRKVIDRYSLDNPGLYFSGLNDGRNHSDPYIYLHYSRKINGYECIGPGNLIIIAINYQGKVSMILSKWQICDEYESCKMISPEQAIQNFKKGIGDIYLNRFDTKIRNVLSTKVVYIMDGTEKQKYAAPWYKFTIEKTNNIENSERTVDAISPALDNYEFYHNLKQNIWK